MNITLKPRNQPKGYGFYLCLRDTEDEQPELFEIRKHSQGCLWMFGATAIIPLSHCEHSALWSDRIEIDYPEGFKS